MGILSGITSFLSGPIGGIALDAASALFQDNRNRAAAGRQMDFQRDMSNTAHQRQVADLAKAGLNPILSSQYGGSSSPPGASYQTSGMVGTLSSTARDASRMAPQVKLMQEQAYAARQAGNQSNAAAHREGMDTDKKEQEMYLVRDQRKLVQQNIEVAREQEKINSATAKTLNANLEGISNESEIDATKMGEILRWINRISNSIQGAGNSGRSVQRLLNGDK